MFMEDPVFITAILNEVPNRFFTMHQDEAKNLLRTCDQRVKQMV